MLELKKKVEFLPWVLSALLYFALAYFVKRSDSWILASIFILLFGCFLWIYKNFNREDLSKYIKYAIVFKLLFLFCIPQLSDDFYRYLWDGLLILEGINPYAHLPTDIDLENIQGFQNIYQGLNSPDYYSVYPPVAQWVFTAGAFAYPFSMLSAIVVIRLLIIAVEIGSMFLLLHLAQKFRIKQKNVILYILNPLIIIELTGNLHFEAFAIFFFLLSMALILHKRIYHAGGVMALAIGIKLLPAVFMPLFIKRLKFKNLMLFYLASGLTLVLIFIPFIDKSWFSGIFESIRLYFQRFEFNASIYYLARQWGFYTKGYNTIQTTGPFLSKLAMFLIILLYVLDYIKKRSMAEMILWIGLIYFLLSTTIHPWYISTLVAFSVLTKYKWPVLWSFLIFFTYFGYSESGYQENWIVLGIEYVGLLVFIIYEIRTNLKRTALLSHEI